LDLPRRLAAEAASLAAVLDAASEKTPPLSCSSVGNEDDHDDFSGEVAKKIKLKCEAAVTVNSWVDLNIAMELAFQK